MGIVGISRGYYKGFRRIPGSSRGPGRWRVLCIWEPKRRIPSGEECERRDPVYVSKNINFLIDCLTIVCSAWHNYKESRV